MWNSYLEKAKALAETIDSQINDAVGIPDENNGAAPATADLNDAWNDDFDDDDNVQIAVSDASPPVVAAPPVPAAVPAVPTEPASLIAIEPESKSLFIPPEQQPENGWDDDIDKLSMEDVDITTPKHHATTEMLNETMVVADLPCPPALNVMETNDEHFQQPQNEEEKEKQPAVNDQVMEEEEEISITPHGEIVDLPVVMDTPSQVIQQEEESPLIIVEEEQESPRVVEESVKDEPQEKLENKEEKIVPRTEPAEPIQEKATVHEAPSMEQHEEEEMNETAIPEVPDTVQQENVNEMEAKEMTVQQPPLLPVPTEKEDERLVVQLQQEHELTILQSQVENLQSQLKQRDTTEEELQMQLTQREDQLASKSEQMTTMQAIYESEKDELRSKIRETKEEAKKRIQRAKERVEDMEKRLMNASEAGAQEEIISALRKEGEKLARKQSEMEKAVRSAKSETRELSASLQEETEQNKKALDKIATLEADLKRTREELASARSGESRASKLDMELSAAKEESELKAAANLSLEQQVKELKEQTKEMMQELQEAKKGAALESARASDMIKKEHTEMLTDLETKLRTSEREASVREDALRHEVAELRKRWQDAVRRADALSMDVQSSTAPLMRQLESTERQNRARAAAWAELETKLRSDLEENVIQNETLIKERNELRTNHSRLQRGAKEMEEELKSSKAAIEEKNAKVQRLEEKLLDLETEGQRMKEEWVEVERLANEGVAKVRSDMMKTVVESEERYRLQVETLEKDLGEEREKRIGFERQLEELLQNAGIASMAPNNVGAFAANELRREKKLKAATGQAEILANTLSGIDSDYEDEESLDDGDQPASSGGFAAMEQLTQRLNGSTLELEALRNQLSESEKTRESLMSELGETRQASEKLPLFEAKVTELTEENKEMELEIMGLRDDIAEVRHLYRTQLDALLEEKAANLPDAKAPEMNGDGARPLSEPVPESEPESTPDPSE